MTGPLRVLSPAKLNLYLDVKRERRPDGYHELCTVFQAVDLFDEVSLERTEGGITVECDMPGVPAGQSNLAVKAARLLCDDAGLRVGVRIRLTKRVPPMSGMGAGSSNAAATLIGLRDLLRTGHADRDLALLAAKLGADVAFFIAGGTQIGRGKGEQLEPVEPPLKGCFVVARAGGAKSTAQVYAEFDRQGLEAPFSVEEALGRLRSGQWGSVWNSLQEPALRLVPGMAQCMETLAGAGALGVAVTGSGACVYGVFETSADANQAAASLAGSFTFVHACKAWHSGVMIVGDPATGRDTPGRR